MTREQERIMRAEIRYKLRSDYVAGMSVVQVAEKNGMKYESIRRAVEFADEVVERKRRQRDHLAKSHPCGIKQSDWRVCFGLGCHNRDNCRAYKSTMKNHDSN